jgi:L-threonylcarbamoyladenylate synthase
MITKDIQLAINELNRGGIIGMPTETVYGLAANIYDENAIRKIFALKKRPLDNPLIVHVSSKERLHELVVDIPDKLSELMSTFCPGPLTFLLKKKPQISNLITANLPTVAIRIPNHQLTIELLDKLEYPLVAPSANPFTRVSPTCARHVHNYFKEELKVVLDGGECLSGLESTIIGYDNDEVIIYRLGAISKEMLENSIGRVKIFNANSHNVILTPGMFKRHYSPKTQLILTSNIQEVLEKNKDLNIAVISFLPQLKLNCTEQFYLSKTGDFKEAAKNLYAKLFEMDELKFDLIVAERFPDVDLGRTINDKLSRAAYKIMV